MTLTKKSGHAQRGRACPLLDTRDQNARVRKRFVPCFVSVIASRARDFARVRRLNALLPCTRADHEAAGNEAAEASVDEVADHEAAGDETAGNEAAGNEAAGNEAAEAADNGATLNGAAHNGAQYKDVADLLARMLEGMYISRRQEVDRRVHASHLYEVVLIDVVPISNEGYFVIPDVPPAIEYSEQFVRISLNSKKRRPNSETFLDISPRQRKTRRTLY